MNILITGSSGFLGKEVVKILKKSNHKLFFLVRKKNKKKNYISCNLKNLNKLKNLLNKLNPDIVINIAAEVNLKKRTKDMYKVNAYAPSLIAKFCKKNDAQLIHVSSIVVHGIKKIYSEKSDYNPVNYYGKSKLKGDILITKSNCRYTILRFGGIYGKKGPNHLSLNKFIDLARKKEKIIFDGNTKSLRNYIFVNDAAKIIVNCIKNKKNGIFYLGGQILSFETMLKKISKIFKLKNEIKFVNKTKRKFNQTIKTHKILNLTSFTKSLQIIKNY